MEVTRVPVLLYHSVSDAPIGDIARWNVTQRTFLGHMDAIADRGCVTLTMSEYLNVLERGEPLPERLVLVTFDDGFADVASFAIPALAERNLSSTLYVTTGAIANDQTVAVHLPNAPMIKASELLGLEEYRVEIGAHSHTHPHLDVVDSRRVREELVMSKVILEDLLQHRVRSFAYPHGYSNTNVRRIAKEVGYESACGVRNAFSSLLDDTLSISRLTVENTTSHATISAWLDRTGAPLGGVREHYQVHLWRLYRRVRFGALQRDHRSPHYEVAQST